MYHFPVNGIERPIRHNSRRFQSKLASCERSHISWQYGGWIWKTIQNWSYDDVRDLQVGKFGLRAEELRGALQNFGARM